MNTVDSILRSEEDEFGVDEKKAHEHRRRELYLAVVNTFRDGECRIISARKAMPMESKEFEKIIRL